VLPELANRRVLRRMDGPLDDTLPAAGAVTVRGLLTFTFGFGMALEMFTAPEPWPVVAAATEAGLATIGPPQPDAFVDPDSWIARFGELPLMAQPGERWLYNTGAHVLSVLCARAVGTSYEEVLRTRIFEPLGMRDTGFHTADVERWRRPTSRRRTGSWSGTRRTASGVGRRRSTTGPLGCCRLWTTCWRSRGCCCAAIRC
jgi:CubicO group peptidase (beta-lactamase class C family)